MEAVGLESKLLHMESNAIIWACSGYIGDDDGKYYHKKLGFMKNVKMLLTTYSIRAFLMNV